MTLKKCFLSLFLCLSLSFQIFAEDHDRTMALSLSPVALILGNADLLYQVKLTRFMALTAPAVFGYNWPLATFLGLFNKVGLGQLKIKKSPISAEGGLGLRFTPFSRVFEDSFYLEPRFTVKYSQFEADIAEEKLGWQKVSLNPQLNLGWDWYYDSGFLMSFGGSIGYAIGLDSKYFVPSEVIKYVEYASRVWPGKIPGTKGYWVYDLEFKLGYSW